MYVGLSVSLWLQERKRKKDFICFPELTVQSGRGERTRTSFPA